jgi:hypothetical protein
MQGGGQIIPDMYANMAGAQPAFVYTAQDIGPNWSPPASTVGSSIGVPPPANIAGQSPNAVASQSQAQGVLARGAGSHPILWLIVLMVIGLVLLGWISHLEVKKRG